MRFLGIIWTSVTPNDILLDVFCISWLKGSIVIIFAQKTLLFLWPIYNIHLYTVYIRTWSELLVPLVNMIKEGIENKPALLILFIFYLKKITKSNLSLN